MKRLTACGFTEQQAEVLAEEQVNLLESNLATKTGLVAVKADIATVKADLLKWMIGAMIAQGGMIVALLKLL